MLTTAIFNIDQLVSAIFSSTTNVFVNNFFYLISLSVNWYSVAGGIIFFSIIFISYGKAKYIFPLLVSTLSGTILIYVLKIIFHRERPEFAQIVMNDYSFPSGHSGLAVAYYGFLFFVLYKNLKTRFSKIVTIICGVVFVILVGLSRIFLGVHYLSDVVFGYIVGIICLSLTIHKFNKKI